MKNLNIQYLKDKSTEYRRTILDMIVRGKASHVGSSFSCVEILTYLYEHILNIDPYDAEDPNRDKLILSKGWAVSTLYSILADRGFFNKEMLLEYCQDGSKLIGCSTRNGIPGIEATTGSMGHGLPLGVGMAMAAKIEGKKLGIYVVISDGECDEGSTWEAALIASHHKLDNLTVVIDHNKWQSFGRVNDILRMEPFLDKWKAFGWSVREVDGHNFKELHEIFSKMPFEANKPRLIIAHTVKGKGVSLLEDRNEWHYKTPSEKEILIAQKELL